MMKNGGESGSLFLMAFAFYFASLDEDPSLGDGWEGNWTIPLEDIQQEIFQLEVN